MELDFIAFAAHPDDAELSMGGTIAKIIKSGKSFGIVDLTQGELGTRGNAETRRLEASEAGKILRITHRENMGFPDGKIQINDGNVKKIVKIIRKYRPKIIFAPYFNDRHPDHIDVSLLIKRAMFQSGLPKIETRINNALQKAYRPSKLFYYVQTYEFQPSFLVDISETFSIKMQAIQAYKTQFYQHEDNSNEPETFISNPEFLKFIEARAKSFGFKIGKEYAEPFYCEESVELDLVNYWGNL